MRPAAARVGSAPQARTEQVFTACLLFFTLHTNSRLYTLADDKHKGISMKFKRALFLIFLLLAAAIGGAFIAQACVDIPFLSWLAFSRPVGFNPDSPLVLDTPMFKFSFALLIDISVAQLLLVAAAIILYNLLVRKR